ncbi:hypothetical protein [Compostimonas suwonensis]|uniref:Uncharacterized protein n=1 Tax=Compostimonas suwonensis TaxID=1048394 RepID=A0A2M9BW52_9MICO|nr:hypothetical protein [Compostimonas suwonensis]PJJ62176.1 hypothetical protein CLV54_1973 [Compostimonas suwonensis]
MAELGRDDFDAARSAVAFVRAFDAQDAEGVNAVLMSLPVDEIPAFVSVMATMVLSAIEGGQVPAEAFWLAMNERIDSLENR